jgi:ferredoxin
MKITHFAQTTKKTEEYFLKLNLIIYIVRCLLKIFKRLVCFSAFTQFFVFFMFLNFFMNMEHKSCVVFCRCGANVISDNELNEISEGLKKLDVQVYELRDLCAFSINEQSMLNSIVREFQQKIIIACYPRAVRNMLRQGGVDFGNFEVINFRDLSPREVLSKLETDYQISQGEARYQVETTALDVPAWFPVIDESLCTLCGKCARFCLFGVYSFNKKSLKVVNPLACKNKCPACGRACPVSAIMFPRIDEKSVLAGAKPGTTNKTTGEGGLFVMLNDRSHSRKNIFRQGLLQQAEEERQKALDELKASIKQQK